MKNFKLSKDQIQKLALSAIGFFVLVYVYFTFFLGPLNRSRDAMLANITDLQNKVASSKNEMMRATNLETQATTATTRFAALKALSPEGAPIAWFPPRMKAFFASQDIDKTSTRLESSTPFKEPDLAEWVRYTWLFDLPQTDFATLGKTVAALENTEPLLSITRISIRTLPDDPQFQQISMAASTAIVKR